MNRFLPACMALAAVCLLPAGPVLAGQKVAVRDARTGLGVAASLILAPARSNLSPVGETIEAQLRRSDARRFLRLAPGTELTLDAPVVVRVEAVGYRTLHALLRPGDGIRGRTLLLEPLESGLPHAEPAPGRQIVDGWVHDHASLAPLADVEISIAGGAARTFSDERGYFRLSLPRLDPRQREPVQVRASKAGFPDWTRKDLLAGSGRTTLQIPLGGPPAPATTHRQLMTEGVWPEAELTGRRSVDPAPDRADRPPASISVGFGDAACSVPCSTGSCSHSCIMSLEEYVRRGVGDEWIASWHHDALAAGSVAYRSYGAWHVFNPPAHGAYDICSSTSCQVNEPDTHTATDRAAAATAGLMLTRQGAVFRSEYSAQNNCLSGEARCTNADLSCGDGFAGSPATGWPCLSDPVGAGRDCFGHGRGMSQWGNHYWTQESPARNWHWQLDHYYNDHGGGSELRSAEISRVLTIGAVRAPAGAVGPGDAFTIDLEAENLAASSHEDVLIGASLRRGTDPFIDDPANDRLVALPAGTTSTSRSFRLPESAPAGSYDLWLALWIDVDRDGAISGDDLSQALVVLDGAVQVGEWVFRDRFEP